MWATLYEPFSSNGRGFHKMRLRLGMDCPENEVVENRSFRVQFSGEGTPYVQTPGEPYIRGKRKVPPEATHLLCVVEIVAP